MAKPSSAHGGANATITTRRRTRSQSAEPVEAERGTSRRGQQAEQIGPSASAPAGRPTKRGSKPQQMAAPELTTVDEDGESDHSSNNQEPHIDARNTGDAGDLEESRRVSAAISVISGTTAKTSFSQEEADAIDPDIVIDCLPDLAASYEGLARVILPAGKATNPATWKDIQTPASKSAKLHRNRIKAIQVYTKDEGERNFGSHDYIQARILLKAMFKTNEPDETRAAAWRPDDIIAKMNLIQMMNVLLIETRDPSVRPIEQVDTLERLLTWFPETIAGREYSTASIEMYTNIAVHVAIARLEASVSTDPYFSPYQIIDAVLLNENNEYKHLDELGINNTTDPNRKRAIRILSELDNALKAPFETENSVSATATVRKLKSKFRWDTLLDHALRFYDNRSSQLAERISSRGGIEAILQGLVQEIERRQHAKEAEMLRQKYKKPLSTQRRSLGSMAQLKTMERQMVEENASSAPPQQTYMVTKPAIEPSPRSRGGTDVVESKSSTQLPAQTSSHAAKSAQFAQALKKRQRARLTDPRPNATRIDLNFDIESVASDRQRTPNVQPEIDVPESSRAGKRRRVDEDEEESVPNPTQDEGFEIDVRDFSAADQRRREIQFAPSPSIQNREHSFGAPRPSNHASSAVDRPSPAKRQRTNPGSSIPNALPPLRPEDGEVPSSTMYQRAKIEAKINRIAVTRNRKNGPRQRHAWTVEEETALVELIDEYGKDGISWANLESIDKHSESPRLGRRNKEDLRFKARNMKVTFLKAGRLPDNWQYVQLGKKEIEALHDADINYEQGRQRAEPVSYDE